MKFLITNIINVSSSAEHQVTNKNYQMREGTVSAREYFLLIVVDLLHHLIHIHIPLRNWIIYHEFLSFSKAKELFCTQFMP